MSKPYKFNVIAHDPAQQPTADILRCMYESGVEVCFPHIDSIAEELTQMTKPYVGMVVQYRYKPDGNDAPVAAIVSKVHDDEWVSLFVVRDPPQYPTHVEFKRCCKEAKAPEPVVPPPPPAFAGYPFP